ncbi:dual specificity protein kinase shkC-like [Montipora capricornis]|uniref:dual specificity protein kinase shkC-like n=1 Tax=Montipora capricornis TaxID=246305 RepID=UPI0035F12626
MGQNHSGNREDEPAPDELQQRINERERQSTHWSRRLRNRLINHFHSRRELINEREGQLRQRNTREEELQQRITDVFGDLPETQSIQGGRREEELQQRINELEGQLRQRGSQMDWVVNRGDIQITSHELGRGAWGVVYRGRFQYCGVAVKEMHEEITGWSRDVFEREVNMASKCRHPCLLLVIGATNDERPLLVTELLECSLRSKLYPSPGELPVENEQAISLDVAYALCYLHEKANPILHNDVSSSNVLLWRSGNGWKAKLSDYGTANFVHRSNINCAGAPVYSAPEFVQTENKISCKADVYSYGVLLCEMSIRQEADQQQLEMQIDSIEKHDPHPKIRLLVRRCVNPDPGNRPSMDEIIEELTDCSRPTHIEEIMTEELYYY